MLFPSDVHETLGVGPDIDVEVLRYMHANGANMFFIAIYLHMFRKCP